MKKRKVGTRSDSGRTPIANSDNENGTRTLDHFAHLLHTGDYRVVFVDGSREELEEGELVVDKIENTVFQVAAVERVADWVERCRKVRLVILIRPEIRSLVSGRPRP